MAPSVSAHSSDSEYSEYPEEPIGDTNYYEEEEENDASAHSRQSSQGYDDEVPEVPTSSQNVPNWDFGTLQRGNLGHLGHFYPIHSNYTPTLPKSRETKRKIAFELGSEGVKSPPFAPDVAQFVHSTPHKTLLASIPSPSNHYNPQPIELSIAYETDKMLDRDAKCRLAEVAMLEVDEGKVRKTRDGIREIEKQGSYLTQNCSDSEKFDDFKELLKEVSRTEQIRKDALITAMREEKKVEMKQQVHEATISEYFSSIRRWNEFTADAIVHEQ